ncbi:hypothetical protein ES703_115848 [subsurface metagenome]
MARKKRIQKDVLVFLTILLPIIFLFSVFNASHKWIVLGSVTSLGFMVYAVFLGADYLIREEKFFHLLIKLLIISAILSAAYALIIYFSEPDLRAEALFAGANTMGEVMFFSIIWTLAFSIHIYGRRKWLLVPGLLMMSLALIFSFSRGAWLGAIGALLAYGFWQRRARLWIAILLLVIGTFLVGLPVLRSRVDLIFNMSHPLNLERIYIWKTTLNMVRAHPWLGVGMGNYAFAYRAYMISGAEIEAPSFAHNIFSGFIQSISGGQFLHLDWDSHPQSSRLPHIFAACGTSFLALGWNDFLWPKVYSGSSEGGKTTPLG